MKKFLLMSNFFLISSQAISFELATTLPSTPPRVQRPPVVTNSSPDSVTALPDEFNQRLVSVGTADWLSFNLMSQRQLEIARARADQRIAGR